MIAIPAIDIMDGKCVRLFRGDFSQRKSYSTNPLDQAKAIEDAGITHLHLVDLDGAKHGIPKNLDVLENIANGTSLRIDFGGGIRSIAAAAEVLDAGAKQVNIGTFLFSDSANPTACIEAFGTQHLIASIDVNHGKVAVHGWQTQTSYTAIQAIENLISVGWSFFSVTDISRDGTMQGPDTDFYKPLIEVFPGVKFIGGGGVSSIDDLQLLRDCGLYASVSGKAIFEGKISLQDLAAFNNA
jgi:phosphoribosylformimino-5-aminoimidazole carboxamide ribotide isomerase